MNNKIDIINYFPEQILYELQSYINDNTYKELEEIRIRVDRPVILKFNSKEIKLSYRSSTQDILEIMQFLCENSIYSYQNQICNGFITIKGGHRVGLTGNVVVKDGKVININYISSLNFRVAKEVIGAADELLKHILNVDKNTIYNTLIVSSPGVGKTTILRDAIRQISNGIPNCNFKGITVGLVDERGEIASMYKGSPQNDLGLRTDILDNISKAEGLKMLIRSMAPKVISTDEIGSEEDINAIQYGITSGVKGIFTAHGDSFEKIRLSPVFEKLLNLHMFEKIVFLSEIKKGSIKKVYELNQKIKDYILLN